MDSNLCSGMGSTSCAKPNYSNTPKSQDLGRIWRQIHKPYKVKLPGLKLILVWSRISGGFVGLPESIAKRGNVSSYDRELCNLGKTAHKLPFTMANYNLGMNQYEEAFRKHMESFCR